MPRRHLKGRKAEKVIEGWLMLEGWVDRKSVV